VPYRGQEWNWEIFWITGAFFHAGGGAWVMGQHSGA
jgi:hypothetical protein